MEERRVTELGGYNGCIGLSSILLGWVACFVVLVIVRSHNLSQGDVSVASVGWMPALVMSVVLSFVWGGSVGSLAFCLLTGLVRWLRGSESGGR